MVRRARRSLPPSNGYSRLDAKDELRRVVREDLVESHDTRRLEVGRTRAQPWPPASGGPREATEPMAVIEARGLLRTTIERYTTALAELQPAPAPRPRADRPGLWRRIRRWLGSR